MQSVHKLREVSASSQSVLILLVLPRTIFSRRKKNAFFLYPQILNIYVLKKMTQYTKPWACLHLELMIDKEVCRTSSPISVLRISKIQRQITHKEKMGCIALVWIHCVLHLISSNPFLQMLYF